MNVYHPVTKKEVFPNSLWVTDVIFIQLDLIDSTQIWISNEITNYS